jgi:hypothetical protein
MRLSSPYNKPVRISSETVRNQSKARVNILLRATLQLLLIWGDIFQVAGEHVQFEVQPLRFLMLS